MYKLVLLMRLGEMITDGRVHGSVFSVEHMFIKAQSDGSFGFPYVRYICPPVLTYATFNPIDHPRSQTFTSQARLASVANPSARRALKSEPS